MKFGFGSSAEKNGIPHIERVAPAAAIPGGEITIHGRGFVSRAQARPVVHFGDAEASLSLAVAVDGNLFKSLPFAVPPAFDLLLGVVRPTGAPVDLDGMHMSNAIFRPAGGGLTTSCRTSRRSINGQ